MMLNRSIVGVGAALLCLSTAHADFTFTYIDGGGDVANGYLQTVDDGGGIYTAVAGWMDVTGGPVAPGSYSLFANPNAPSASYSPSGYFIYDDMINVNMDPVVDNNGLLFAGISLDGATEINIFSNGPGSSYTYYDNAGYNNGPPGTFTLANVTPEPFTLCIGAAGVLLAARRRSKARTTA